MRSVSLNEISLTGTERFHNCLPFASSLQQTLAAQRRFTVLYNIHEGKKKTGLE